MADLTPGRLVLRSLTHYWRTNAAVVVGVAVAVTVLAGALLVGDSVRGSLRDLVLQRLGNTDQIVVSTDFFRARLADDLRADPSFDQAFANIAPLVAVQGLATDQETGRRSSRVHVYGVDDRFWAFHGLADVWKGVEDRDVLLSPALARDIGAVEGGTLLLRVQRPTDIPLESLHGRKDDLGRTVRLTVRRVLPAAELGEFALQPSQGDVRAAFVPMARLQQDLEIGERANALVVSARRDVQGGAATRLEALVRERATLEDLGLRIRLLDRQHVLSLESESALIDEPRAEAARRAAAALGTQALPVLTYLVNTIRLGDREIPYSLVSAVELGTIVPGLAAEEGNNPPIVLNEWAARDLGARTGDRLTLEYYVWEDPGRLATQSAGVEVAAVVPIAGAAADRDLAPEYPGITESEALRDWDPPFPIDLRRIRPVDEDYWREHRTTPKAFIAAPVGAALWRSRYGALTSLRIPPPAGLALADAGDRLATHLRAALDPLANGLSVREVRASGLAASRGATNFGEYFAYFSFFLVVSAITLGALFFKLGIEQRVREVGLLRAVGFSTPAVRRLFAAEGLLLAVLGALIGVVGAVAYGGLMMAGLRTWWVDAVGTTALTLHVAPVSLLAGALGGVIAAMVCVWWTLRSLARVSERSLLAGQLTRESDILAGADLGPGHPMPRRSRGPRRALSATLALLALAALLLALTSVRWLDPTPAFFGAGAAMLGACLSALAFWLQRPPRAPLAGHGWWPMSRLGLRNATYRPARSVLSVAVMASAAFVLISVDAFRRDEAATFTEPTSGTGGYALLVDMVLPLVHDPNSADGRELLGLSSLDDVSIVPFRVLPGDDASCLNLYRPQQPRVMGVRRELRNQGRFAFQGALDRSDEERDNPWLLLDREQPDAAIPVIADANSMTYVLHVGLGDEIVIDHAGRPVRLRVVAALRDSIFQGELLMSEENFLKVFPDQEGYRFLLVDAPPARADEVTGILEDRLADFGADAVPTGRRLAEFHRVENTYLSTFQTLGGLGLLLGTVGLAAVLLRNVLERRRELALLGAVGYGRARLFVIVLAESTLLLACGLAAGTICALIAITPAALERGGAFPTGAGSWLLLFAVFATGLVSSVVATRAALQARLLDALRTE